MYNLKMKKILIATTNKAKLEEIKNGLKPLLKQKIKLLTLTDVGVEEKPEESGKTFCENAKIKAKFYAKKTNLPTLADDGGLLIPSLNNEPGVRSRRWLGCEEPRAKPVASSPEFKLRLT
jgi:XTP/dITP diphosphohydrolase